MTAFLAMSREWKFFFAFVVIVLLLLATWSVTVKVGRPLNLVALALAVWAFFYYYAVLAKPRGAITINGAWWAAHKKAIAAFLTVLVTDASSLIALGVLSGPVSHDLALGLVVAGPILAFFGVKIAAPNAPLP